MLLQFFLYFELKHFCDLVLYLQYKFYQVHIQKKINPLAVRNSCNLLPIFSLISIKIETTRLPYC